MSTAAQKAFFVSLAAFARSTANLLDEMSKNDDAPAETPKPAPAAKKKETPAPAAAAAAAPEAGKSQAGPTGDLVADARKAAKAYAEVYGREGLKEQLSKFTDKTLADVPADKLPELIKALS